MALEEVAFSPVVDTLTSGVELGAGEAIEVFWSLLLTMVIIDGARVVPFILAPSCELLLTSEVSDGAGVVVFISKSWILLLMLEVSVGARVVLGVEVKALAAGAMIVGDRVGLV